MCKSYGELSVVVAQLITRHWKKILNTYIVQNAKKVIGNNHIRKLKGTPPCDTHQKNNALLQIDLLLIRGSGKF